MPVPYAFRLPVTVLATAFCTALPFSVRAQTPPAPVGIDAEFEPRTKCERIVGDAHIDEGWVCHNCNVYNGVQRDKCRNCNHERCDVVVPPPPPPADPSAH